MEFEGGSQRMVGRSGNWSQSIGRWERSGEAHGEPFGAGGRAWAWKGRQSKWKVLEKCWADLKSWLPWWWERKGFLLQVHAMGTPTGIQDLENC